MNLHTNLDLTPKSGKEQKKVAETAEIPQTAPQTQPKIRKRAGKK